MTHSAVTHRFRILTPVCYCVYIHIYDRGRSLHVWHTGGWCQSGVPLDEPRQRSLDGVLVRVSRLLTHDADEQLQHHEAPRQLQGHQQLPSTQQLQHGTAPSLIRLPAGIYYIIIFVGFVLFKSDLYLTYMSHVFHPRAFVMWCWMFVGTAMIGWFLHIRIFYLFPLLNVFSLKDDSQWLMNWMSANMMWEYLEWFAWRRYLI